MARLPILIAPDPRLKKIAKPVAAVDQRVARLMDDMLETMYQANGIGLAAPQVAILERVIVVDVADRDITDPAPLRLANPEIVWTSEERAVRNEGCLSLPDLYADVERPAAVKVRYLDESNRAREIEASDLLATCLQHEIDHLNGVLFVDHITKIRRDMFLRKLQKAKKAGTLPGSVPGTVAERVG